VKPGFTDRVMRQIATRPLPRPSLWRRITRPRTITFSPLRMAALGTALAVLACIFIMERPRPTLPAPQRVAVPGPTLVRFALAAPDAEKVSVAGDFNGWRADAAPAERGPDGVWRVTLPISSGNWSYSFVVDGKFVEDPQAEAWREDGFGGRNAVVRVN
jgi:Carbohydrate-binding module 48 (Isoamylase N-terminal domain)